MAIPTQFSVTTIAKCPIANPLPPKDIPQAVDAENVSIVGSVDILSSLAAIGVDAPDTVTAQPVTDIDSAVTIPANAAADIDTPNSVTAEVAATVGTPSAVEAEDATDVDTPDSVNAQSPAAINTPDSVTAQSESSVPTPSVITPNTGTLLEPPFPLNHARIMWDNKLTVNEGYSATNGNASAPNALKPNTWERWSFTGESVLTVQFTYLRPIDTVCIGSHNLGTLSRLVNVEYSPTTSGDDFVSFASLFYPDDDRAIMIYNESAPSVRRLRITIGGGDTVYIGYISAGLSLQMQRPFFNGHIPITDGDVTEYYSNRTESGEIIGQQILRQGYETTADWNNIDDEWYREYFAPFKQGAKLRPFFFAWNLLEYPLDVGFCRIAQDIRAPMQNGTRTKRSISMNLLGAG